MSNANIRHACGNNGVLVVHGSIILVFFVVFDWVM